jgi:hypothetical protein
MTISPNEDPLELGGGRGWSAPDARKGDYGMVWWRAGERRRCLRRVYCCTFDKYRDENRIQTGSG